MALFERGSFEKYGSKLIGANVDAIKRGEDREIFKKIVETVGENQQNLEFVIQCRSVLMQWYSLSIRL